MIGIVDVGGGTRGIYGAGVFDRLLDDNIHLDHVVGVSAGSANGCSYISGQKGRNLVYYSDYAFRKEYMSFSNLFKTGSYIGLDYIYGTLSNEGGEYPLDHPAMMASDIGLDVVATNGITGETVYFEKKDIQRNNYDFMKASCCVPVINKPYFIDGVPYFDGGLTDPIPFQRAFKKGCEKVVVVLTRPRDHFRKPAKDKAFAKVLRRSYPKAAEALENRCEVYNKSLEEATTLEKEGKVLIIAPDDISGLKTLTQDYDRLIEMYEKGYKDAEAVRDFI